MGPTVAFAGRRRSWGVSDAAYDERSSLALHGLSGGRSVNRDPARNHLHGREFVDMMIAHLLPAAKVEYHDPALGRREQNTRILMTDRRHAWPSAPGSRATRFSDEGRW
jgi:hypothetical protein